MDEKMNSHTGHNAESVRQTTARGEKTDETRFIKYRWCDTARSDVLN